MLVYPPKYLVNMLAPYVDKQALREGKVSERLIKAMHIARYYEVAIYYNLLIRGTRVYIAPSIINGATGNDYPEVSVEGSAATYGIEVKCLQEYTFGFTKDTFPDQIHHDKVYAIANKKRGWNKHGIEPYVLVIVAPKLEGVIVIPFNTQYQWWGRNIRYHDEDERPETYFSSKDVMYTWDDMLGSLKKKGCLNRVP